MVLKYLLRSNGAHFLFKFGTVSAVNRDYQRVWSKDLHRNVIIILHDSLAPCESTKVDFSQKYFHLWDACRLFCKVIQTCK